MEVPSIPSLDDLDDGSRNSVRIYIFKISALHQLWIWTKNFVANEKHTKGYGPYLELL